MLHFSKKILIGISLIISFVLTLVLSAFLTPPYPQISTIITSIEKIRANKIAINFGTLFSLPKITTGYSLSTPSPVQTTGNNNPIFSNLPTTANSQQNQTISPIPTAINNNPTPTTYNQLPTPTNIPPTVKNTPKPKPTKPPKPTPTEKITIGRVRPGKNFVEAAEVAGKIMCIPPAMILATLDKEYGPWKAKIEADWTNLNTYPGSDPHNKPGSTAVVSVMQMMEDTWSRIKPIISEKLGTETSIAVTFDALAAGGYHLRNISLAMQDHVSCEDWPVKYILYGACRYNGACTPGATTYNQYSYDVCNNYNTYTKGPKKNCK